MHVACSVSGLRGYLSVPSIEYDDTILPGFGLWPTLLGASTRIVRTSLIYQFVRNICNDVVTARHE